MSPQLFKTQHWKQRFPREKQKNIGSYFNSTRQQRSTTRGRESESSLASGIEILCESPPVEANRWQVDADNNHLTRNKSIKMPRFVAWFAISIHKHEFLKLEDEVYISLLGWEHFDWNKKLKGKWQEQKRLGRIKQTWTVVSRQQLKYCRFLLRIGGVEFYMQIPSSPKIFHKISEIL